MKFIRRRPVPPLWLLGLLTFSGPVGMHIFVPALPAAAKDLHATPVALEMTISLYILGLAVGQLLYGPASDRFGRRPALLVGLSIFTIASVAGLFAPDVHTLVVARFFQALGGCSGLVLARAMIRDTSQAHEAARRLALTNLLVTAGPAVAPLIGGGLSALWGWRTILVGLSALGAANFMMAWLLLQETRPEALFVSASRYARDYVGLLRSRQFLGYAIGGACATTSLYAFIACAPFIFIDRLHVPSASVGLYLALLVSGIWLGSLLASRLISRFSLTRFVVVANAVSVVAAASFLGFVIADRATSRSNCRNDVRVQRRRGRGGARGPRQGDQREPARHGNSVWTLRFGSDGCRRDAGYARRLGVEPGVRLRVRASCRRHCGAGVLLDRPKPERRRLCARKRGRVKSSDVTVLRAATRELVADLGQENDFLGGRGRRRRLLRRPSSSSY